MIPEIGYRLGGAIRFDGVLTYECSHDHANVGEAIECSHRAWEFMQEHPKTTGFEMPERWFRT